jgi:hypothetical protein
MRRLKILTWHTRGSYLYYLSQAPHDFFVLSKPGRPPGYGGRCANFPWGDNVHDLPVEAARSQPFDCILFQARDQWEGGQFDFLTPAQRALPRIYLEHDPPQAHPTDTAHPVDDPNLLLVHVTPFNALMWDNRRTPTRVIEHGVLVPDSVRYLGALERGLVIGNHLDRRGRRMGRDLFLEARSALPLDLVGLASEALGGLGSVPHAQLPALAARYRFLFSPSRYASLDLGVIEAMMAGLPVVALATNEMATVIDDGANGFIDTRIDRLFDCMRELLRSPSLARDLGQAARRRAQERFSIERFSADWDAAFRLVTGNLGPGSGACD